MKKEIGIQYIALESIVDYTDICMTIALIRVFGYQYCLLRLVETIHRKPHRIVYIDLMITMELCSIFQLLIEKITSISDTI